MAPRATRLQRPLPTAGWCSNGSLRRVGALAAALATTPDREASAWASALAGQCRDIIDDLAHLAPWTSLPASAKPQTHLPGFTSIPTLSDLAALDDERTAGPGQDRLAQSPRRTVERSGGHGVGLSLRRNTPPPVDWLQRRRPPPRFGLLHLLLASEARFCTFVGIAQGHLPQESWFALGRLLTTAAGEPVLLSWSGSMSRTIDAARRHAGLRRDPARPDLQGGGQMWRSRSAKRRGVPRGISESGYNMLDARLTYQYRAFGVPGLGLQRGLADDLVIAPYASALALMVAYRGGVREPPAARGRRGSLENSASTKRSTTRRRACPGDRATRSCGPTWRITRG